jgi:ribosomal protein S27E
VATVPWGNTLADTATDEIKKTQENPSSNSVRVRCSACNYTLLEAAIETPQESRVWLKLKCKGCRTYNVVVFKDGTLSVSVVR